MSLNKDMMRALASDGTNVYCVELASKSHMHALEGREGEAMRMGLCPSRDRGVLSTFHFHEHSQALWEITLSSKSTTSVLKRPRLTSCPTSWSSRKL